MTTRIIGLSRALSDEDINEIEFSNSITATDSSYFTMSSATVSAPLPAPFPVTVHPFQSPTPLSCAYELGSSSSKNALVFIGGLGDGPHTVPYIRAVAKKLESATGLGYSVFETRLRSSFTGFGYSRLSDDVADISALVKHLRGIGKQKIVLMGHSTGCQVRRSTILGA